VVEVVVQEDNKIFQDILGFLLLGLLDLKEDLLQQQIGEMVDLGLVLLVVIMDHQAAILQEEIKEIQEMQEMQEVVRLQEIQDRQEIQEIQEILERQEILGIHHQYLV
jgi:hypothetical protein